jgi:hypothetical protein
LVGIASKGERWEDCSDFPWPPIRSALVDLVRIGQAMQPGTFIAGSDRNGAYLRRHRNGCCFQACKGPSVSGN